MVVAPLHRLLYRFFMFTPCIGAASPVSLGFFIDSICYKTLKRHSSKTIGRKKKFKPKKNNPLNKPKISCIAQKFGLASFFNWCCN